MMRGSRPASTLTQDELEMQVEGGNYASSMMTSINTGDDLDQELTLYPASQINSSAYGYNTRYHKEVYIYTETHPKELSSYSRDGVYAEVRAGSAERGELHATSERASKRIRLTKKDTDTVKDIGANSFNTPKRAAMNGAKSPRAGSHRGMVDDIAVGELTIQSNTQSNSNKANEDTYESAEHNYRATSNATSSARTPFSASVYASASSESTGPKAGSSIAFGSPSAGYDISCPKVPATTSKSSTSTPRELNCNDHHPSPSLEIRQYSGLFAPVPSTSPLCNESESVLPPYITPPPNLITVPTKRGRAQKAKTKAPVQPIAPESPTDATAVATSTAAPVAHPPFRRSRKKRPPTELLVAVAEPKLDPLRWRAWNIETQISDIANGVQEIAASLDVSSISSSSIFANKIADISRSLGHIASYMSIPLRGMIGYQQGPALPQSTNKPSCEELVSSQPARLPGSPSNVQRQQDVRAVDGTPLEQNIPDLAGSGPLSASLSEADSVGQAHLSRDIAMASSQSLSSRDVPAQLILRETYVQLHNCFLACHTKHVEAVELNEKLKTQVQRLTRKVERMPFERKEHEKYREFWVKHNLVAESTGMTPAQSESRELGIARKRCRKLEADVKQRDEAIRKLRDESNMSASTVKDLKSELDSKDKELDILRATITARDQELASLNMGTKKAGAAKSTLSGLLLPGMDRAVVNPPASTAKASPGRLLLPGSSQTSRNCPVATTRPAISLGYTAAVIAATSKGPTRVTATRRETATVAAAVPMDVSAARHTTAPPRLSDISSAVPATRSASLSGQSSSDEVIDLTMNDDDAPTINFRPMKRGATYDWLPKAKKSKKPQPFPSDRRRSRDAAASAAASREGSTTVSSPAYSFMTREGSMAAEPFAIDDDNYVATAAQGSNRFSVSTGATGVASATDVAIVDHATATLGVGSDAGIAYPVASPRDTIADNPVQLVHAAVTSLHHAATPAIEESSGDSEGSDDDLEQMLLDELVDVSEDETKDAEMEVENNSESLLGESLEGKDDTDDGLDSLFNEPMPHVEDTSEEE